MNSFELYTIKEEDSDSGFEIEESETEIQYEIFCLQKFTTWTRRILSLYKKPVFYMVYVCSLFAVITFIFKTLADPPMRMRNRSGLNQTKIDLNQTIFCNDTPTYLDNYVDTDINITGFLNSNISRAINCIPRYAMEHNNTELGVIDYNNTIPPELDNVSMESNRSTLKSNASTSKLNTSFLGVSLETAFAVLIDIIFKQKLYPSLVEPPDVVSELNDTDLDI